MTRYVRFTDAVQANSIRALLKAVDKAVADGEEELHLLMSSGGGSTFWGATAYSYLRGAPLRVVTHNMGRCDSVALAVYLAGERRLATSHATFLLHPNKANFAQGGLERGALEERLAGLHADEAKVAAMIGERTGRSAEEVATATASRTPLNAPDAVTWGIAHDIVDSLFPPGTSVVDLGEPAK